MIKKPIKILIFLTLLSLVGCQKEEYEVLGEDQGVAVTSDSEFHHLVQRSAMHDGSADDQIDQSPCLSIQFPYTIELDGMEIEIHSQANLAAVLGSIEEAEQNHVSIRFPVNVKTSSHEEVTVSNKRQMAGLQQGCRNQIREDLAPISCIQIEFPIKIFSYNSEIQESSSETIRNKAQLYWYLENVSDAEILSFEFPIRLIYKDKTFVKVNNRSAMENAFQSCIE